MKVMLKTTLTEEMRVFSNKILIRPMKTSIEEYSWTQTTLNYTTQKGLPSSFKH